MFTIFLIFVVSFNLVSGNVSTLDHQLLERVEVLEEKLASLSPANENVLENDKDENIRVLTKLVYDMKSKMDQMSFSPGDDCPCDLAYLEDKIQSNTANLEVREFL